MDTFNILMRNRKKKAADETDGGFFTVKHL